MRILWISNIQFPVTCRRLGILPHISGGWMISLAERLAEQKEVDLSVCTTYSGQNLLKIDDECITFYLLPRKKSNSEYDASLEIHWARIIN